MGKSSTSFSTANQPKDRTPRGKSKRTLILEAAKARGVFGIGKDATNEEAEVAFFGELMRIAGDPEDGARNVAMKCLMDKGWANIKSVAEPVNFELPDDATPTEQANYILKAISQGEIPPDIGSLLISSLSSVLKIEEMTDIKEQVTRIKEQLEALQDAKS